MRPVERYKRHYRRFTWNNRIAYGAPVLTGRRDTRKDECGYYSVISALESNLRIQRGFVDNLSIKYLKQKHMKVIQTNGAISRLGKVEQLLNMLKDIGVPSEHLYNLNLKGQRLPCPMHKISGYKRYDVSQYFHIRSALQKHLRHGPMLVFSGSAITMSTAWNGSIYRFSGIHELEDRREGEDERRWISHSVCVVNCGIEETVPFLMFRTDKAGWPEFGRVEIQSVKELYGINM